MVIIFPGLCNQDMIEIERNMKFNFQLRTWYVNLKLFLSCITWNFSKILPISPQNYDADNEIRITDSACEAEPELETTCGTETCAGIDRSYLRVTKRRLSE